MKLIKLIQSRLSTVNWKSKFKALAAHLGISLIIFFVLIYLILYKWYPFPYFTTDGGIQGMRLVFFIDMILGPTLTFVVFRTGKAGLKFDLSLIAVMQFLALGWGVLTIHSERPAAVVFTDDRFTPIAYHLLPEAGIKPDDLKKFDHQHPVKIYVDMPDEKDAQTRMKFFQQAYKNQTPLFLLGKHYQKIDAKNAKKILAKSIDIDDYLKQDYIQEQSPVWQERYAKFKTKNTRAEIKLAYIAFFARHGRYILVIDRKTMQFIDVLDIKPPQSTQLHIKANP